MFLVRFNPWRNFLDVESTLDRFFDDSFGRFFEDGGANGRWVPAVDVREEDDDIVYTVELPGFEKKEIEISVEDRYLAVTGERKFEKQEEEKYHRVERRYGKFYRSFQLPESVDSEKISAKLKNGVLTLRLPKKEEVKPRQIPVSVN